MDESRALRRAVMLGELQVLMDSDADRNLLHMVDFVESHLEKQPIGESHPRKVPVGCLSCDGGIEGFVRVANTSYQSLVVVCFFTEGTGGTSRW